jgi:hypothetical protein
MRMRGGGPLPAQVPRGPHGLGDHDRQVPAGNGQLIWAPDGRNTVSWDFSVEID